MKHLVPVDGTVRVVTRFLFLPKTIGGKTRWLECATWKMEFVAAEGVCFWNDTRWL